MGEVCKAEQDSTPVYHICLATHRIYSEEEFVLYRHEVSRSMLV